MASTLWADALFMHSLYIIGKKMQVEVKSGLIGIFKICHIPPFNIEYQTQQLTNTHIRHPIKDYGSWRTAILIEKQVSYCFLIYISLNPVPEYFLYFCFQSGVNIPHAINVIFVLPMKKFLSETDIYF